MKTKVTYAAVCFTFATFGFASAASAASFCDNSTLKGTYVYAEEVVGDDGKTSAIAGFEYFDGNGNIVAIENDSNDKVTGATAAEAKITDHAGNGDTSKITGTYKVESDCRGVAVYVDGPTTRLFAEPNGDSFHWMTLNDGQPSNSFGEDHRYSTSNLIAE